MASSRSSYLALANDDDGDVEEQQQDGGVPLMKQHPTSGRRNVRFPIQKFCFAGIALTLFGCNVCPSGCWMHYIDPSFDLSVLFVLAFFAVIFCLAVIKRLSSSIKNGVNSFNGDSDLDTIYSQLVKKIQEESDDQDKLQHHNYRQVHIFSASRCNYSLTHMDDDDDDDEEQGGSSKVSEVATFSANRSIRFPIQTFFCFAGIALTLFGLYYYVDIETLVIVTVLGIYSGIFMLACLSLSLRLFTRYVKKIQQRERDHRREELLVGTANGPQEEEYCLLQDQYYSPPPTNGTYHIEERKFGISHKKSGAVVLNGSPSLPYVLRLNFSRSTTNNNGWAIRGSRYPSKNTNTNNKGVAFDIPKGLVSGITREACWQETGKNGTGRIVTGQFDESFASFCGEWLASDGTRGSLLHSVHDVLVAVETAVPLGA